MLLDHERPAASALDVDGADALFKEARRRTRRRRARIAVVVVALAGVAGYLAAGGGGRGGGSARSPASSGGGSAGSQARGGGGSTAGIGRGLKIVLGSAQPKEAFVMGGILRLAPGSRSYRLVGYGSSRVCDSVALSPNGRFLIYGVSQGGWPALEILDLASGARSTFHTRACDPAWGSDGQIAYVHYVAHQQYWLSYTAQVLVQQGLDGAPRAWTGDAAWANPTWAGHDLLVSDGSASSADPGALVVAYGPGRQRIVERRPRGYSGPVFTVVAINPSGTEALLDTQTTGPRGGARHVEDQATLLRVGDDKVLSTIHLPLAAYGEALGSGGSWRGSEIITTDGLFLGGSAHPATTLITLTATGDRLQLRSIRPFVGLGLEPMRESQNLYQPSQARFLDPSGQQVALWFSGLGALWYLDCDLRSSRCVTSRNYSREAQIPGNVEFVDYHNP